MRYRKWASGSESLWLGEKVSNGVRECRSRGVKENYPDTPIPRYPDSKKAGVTLIELLVALTVFALLMVAFYTVFKIGNKAYETGKKRVELTQNARVALDMMASQIRQALPGTLSIDGSGKWITFYAPVDGTEGAEKIQFSRYSDEPGVGNETNTLYKRVDNPWAKGVDPDPSSQPVTADLPMTETEGIVSGLLFEENASDGLIRITMELKADPIDDNEPEIILHDIVKVGFCYGIGMGGGF